MRPSLFLFCVLLSFNQSVLGQFVNGIDVSNWQGNIDWNAVSSDGQVYAWSKATEGMTYQDPQFINNMTNGLSAGVVMGAYHFARPDNNLATEDAANFLAHASPYIGPGFLPPVLDLENPYSGGQAILLSDLFTSTELSNWALEWMSMVENETGVSPMIYINGIYANYLNSSLNTYGLWFAQPDELMTPPTNIGNWSNWSFKQYSWWGEVSGIVGDVDLNIFNGSINEFNDLIGVTSAQIDSPNAERQISFYPNPVINEMLISGDIENIQNISIYGFNGKKQSISNGLDGQINLSHLRPGVYLLKIRFEKEDVFIARFIKS